MTIIELPRPMPETLGVGPYLKNTVTLIQGREARISPIAGDLGTPEAIAAFERSIAAFDPHPLLVAHDLHPDFYSTRWAERQNLAPCLPVQHHHAHIAAIMAERGLMQPILGLALDGFGLGSDQGAWGGELLWVDGADFRRLGHFANINQPGSDKAAREPWRMAASVLARLGRGAEIAGRYGAFPAAAHMAEIIERGLNAPLTSSAGRLFDAASALLGICLIAKTEAEAPMALEALVTAPKIMADGWRISPDGVLDLLPMMEALIDMEPASGADLFHGTLIAALTEWSANAAERTGARHVAMAGGCFFNRILREGLTEALQAQKLIPLSPIVTSPGDPSISLGQAWIAAMTLG